MANILLISIDIPIFFGNINIYMNNLLVGFLFYLELNFNIKNIMIIQYTQIVDSLKFTY